MQHQEEKIPTINEVEKNWDMLSTIYSEFDSTPQSFYFSIVNILEIPKAKNILEIGCGRCLLVPYCVQLKNPEATYMATDLSPKMVELAEKQLKHVLDSFESKLSFEEWCKKQNFTLKVHNGEEPIPQGIKFDRIICNMVLMLTENPSKMLKTLYDQSEEGCFLGVSVWGKRELNLIHHELDKVVEELKVQVPKIRSNFHLYNKIQGLAEEQGWKTVATWEQISIFPYLYASSLEAYAQKMTAGMAFLNEEQRKWVFEEYMRRQKERLDEKKQALTFPAQIVIFRK